MKQNSMDQIKHYETSSGGQFDGLGELYETEFLWNRLNSMKELKQSTMKYTNTMEQQITMKQAAQLWNKHSTKHHETL